MIKLRGPRPLRAALAVVVLLGGTAASSADATKAVVIACSMLSGGGSMSLSCGDLELEAEIRARALKPDEARAAGCEPITWDDGSDGGSNITANPPEMIATGEPEPTYSPRTPDPAVRARVDRAWDRVERWLGAHASATLRKLKFPATAQDLARWEAERGRRLPDDLYASYLRHDGADGNLGDGFRLPPAYGLLGLYEIDYVNREKCEDLVMDGDRSAADPAKGKWHGSLLPFGDSSRGQELFVDPRTGRVGESAWGENLRYDGPMGWPSYAALLEALAGSLEAGTPLRDWYPTVTATCELRWSPKPTGAPPANCAGGPRPAPAPTPTPAPEPTEEEKPTPEEARATGCRPARRRPVVRMPDPAVAARVEATWRRIEAWLARRAPATYRTLRGPATPRAIARAEAAMGLTFPDDLRASLLRHDGAPRWGGFGPAPFYAYMPVKAVYSDWKMLCGIVLDGPADMAEGWWDGHLIPFASAIDGGNLFVDSRTGKTGEYFDEEGLTLEGDVVWPSYLALLRDTAESLRTGRPIRGWRPRVKKGELDWVQAKRR
ncbi:SMI1/KNR4 family protein [Sphaerisporangium fuscum]|uniref:SMI1/KNR4 family protein n=1 Tax=Sphaerisporangium fuscum TaxID=2835868 RepID=UPI001BDD0AAB|nr:SMI1/KNR4 family protein [Sphaerisporangium fuscum]